MSCVSDCPVPKYVNSRRVHINLYTKHPPRHLKSSKLESKMPRDIPKQVWDLAHSDIDLSAPITVRMAQAKAWLRVYPDETAASTARLYELKPDTLQSSIHRDTLSNTHQVGGLNRVRLLAVICQQILTRNRCFRLVKSRQFTHLFDPSSSSRSNQHMASSSMRSVTLRRTNLRVNLGFRSGLRSLAYILSRPNQSR
jgi:hypothetical protein